MENERNIHPEIRKFWEDTGYTITKIPPGSYQNNTSNEWWAGVYNKVAVQQETDIVYFCMGKCVSEHDMLRIVRLKPFL